MIVSLSTQNNWKVNEMDVKSIIFNDTLEEVYVKQLAEYDIEGK